LAESVFSLNLPLINSHQESVNSSKNKNIPKNDGPKIFDSYKSQHQTTGTMDNFSRDDPYLTDLYENKRKNVFDNNNNKINLENSNENDLPNLGNTQGCSDTTACKIN